jgi:hypothetical protein
MFVISNFTADLGFAAIKNIEPNKAGFVSAYYRSTFTVASICFSSIMI